MGWLFQWSHLAEFLMLAAIFVPLERILSIHRRPWLRRGITTDLAYVVIGGSLIRLGFIFLFVFSIAFRDSIVPAGLMAAIRSQPVWLQFIEVVILSDLCFYAVHRLFHTVPWLWRFHSIHHSIEEMDWLAGHRVHPVDQVLTKGAAFLPVVALGFSEGAVAAAAIVYHWHSVLLHSNVRLPLRFMEKLVATPNFHHWHHSNEPEAWDKNFAGQLSIIDRLFGTAFMPNGRVPGIYGVDDPVPTGYLAQLIYPFRRPNRPAPVPATRDQAGPEPAPALPAE